MFLERYYERDIGCYLEEYRARVGTWAVWSYWWSALGHVGTRGGNIYMLPMILCAAVLATLLTIGGVELNPETEDNVVQVLCRAAAGT